MDYSKQAKQAKKLLRKALEKNTEKPKKLKYAKAPDIPKPDHVTEQKSMNNEVGQTLDLIAKQAKKYQVDEQLMANALILKELMKLNKKDSRISKPKHESVWAQLQGQQAKQVLNDAVVSHGER